MKKILSIVSYTFLPAKTGGQKSIASFNDQLTKYFDLVCVGTDHNDGTKAKYKMYNILSTSPLRYINPFNFFRLRNIVRAEKPDYIELEHPYMGWLAILLKKATGTKLIVRSHNIEGLRFKNLNKWWWKILLRYEGWVHRNADVNYFISNEDRDYVLKHFRLETSKTFTITFGINISNAPSKEEQATAETFIKQAHSIPPGSTIILFNGAFDYRPNVVALDQLVNKIFPYLKSIATQPYKLIVCGKDTPQQIIESNKDSDIIFAGFVPDIVPYLTGAKIFVNPITEGGGIKTKLVEALGYNLNCISYRTGAIGVSRDVCGEKLVIVDDGDVKRFAKEIINAASITSTIPQAFFDLFSLEKIMQKIKSIL